MSSLSNPKRWACLLLLGTLWTTLAAPAGAVPTVRPFSKQTWNDLKASPSRPLAVVFTTTDCTHCPKVIDQLAARLRKAQAAARLVVVVMDGAGQEGTLRQDAHYSQVGQLYAFADDETTLRYAVNPDWRGLTPYVALLPAEGAPRFHTGAPPDSALDCLLKP